MLTGSNSLSWVNHLRASTWEKEGVVEFQTPPHHHGLRLHALTRSNIVGSRHAQSSRRSREAQLERLHTSHRVDIEPGMVGQQQDMAICTNVKSYMHIAAAHQRSNDVFGETTLFLMVFSSSS